MNFIIFLFYFTIYRSHLSSARIYLAVVVVPIKFVKFGVILGGVLISFTAIAFVARDDLAVDDH